MSDPAKIFSGDIEDLKALLVAKDEQLLVREKLVTAKYLRIAELEEQLQLLLHKRFGVSSEKTPTAQMNLFNEAEAVSEAADETTSSTETETTVPEHKRKKPGRKPLPENLPRIIIEHDIPEEENFAAVAAADRA